MVNIVIPSAGLGSRFSGITDVPKPFIEINNKTMIELSIDSIIGDSSIQTNQYICFQKSHKEYSNKIFHKKLNVDTLHIDYITSGQAETVLLLLKNIDNENPIIVANCDQIVSWDLSLFLHYCKLNNLDGCIPVFESDSPKWSYALIDDSGFIVKTAEKKVISKFATVGIYYWKNKKICEDSIFEMFLNKDITNNETYLCPAYNYLIKNGGKVMPWYDIQMNGVGTPEDLDIFIKTTTKNK
jgi:NDP-sugar pyrophosphorylase family protein